MVEPLHNIETATAHGLLKETVDPAELDDVLKFGVEPLDHLEVSVFSEPAHCI